MYLRPRVSTHAGLPTEEADRSQTPRLVDGAWRWAVLYIPWLDGVTPRGQLVMVSDKRHIAEARKRHPELPLWHEKELALFGDQMDAAELGAREFVSVNRLKLKSGGWFMGVGHGGTRASSGEATRSSVEASVAAPGEVVSA